MNEQQREAVQLARLGQSFFLTGAGGTGKSYVIGQICATLRKKKTIALTAMTGCAAVLLGDHAMTLHAWAGIGLGDAAAEELTARVKKSKEAYRRWSTTHMLIIDEVSMLAPDLLDKLNYIGQRVRERHDVPMGGIQVILVGDFYQLPPVLRGGQSVFAFDAQSWSSIVPQTVELVQVMRQKDAEFYKILQEARIGEISDESIAILGQCVNKPMPDSDSIQPTILLCLKRDVDTINAQGLAKLGGQRRIFRASTQTTLTQLATSAAIQKLDKEGPYAPILELALGAQVMLIKNLSFDTGLVNGSRGVVVNFTTNAPIVRFTNGQEMEIKPVTWNSRTHRGVARLQVPLILAYAITIHKAQGATLDCVQIDIGPKTFACGQAYVALSRVRNLQGLYVVSNVHKASFCAHPRVKSFYEHLS